MRAGGNLVPTILYEDSDVLVLDKPSGLVVNRAASVREKFTLMDWLATEWGERLGSKVGSGRKEDEKMSEFEMRCGVVHRLDKDTSGIMVTAKNERAFISLQGQFKDRSVVKEYVALSHIYSWDFSKDKDLSRFAVDAPIGRNPKNRMKWAVVKGGRSAVTEFEVLSTYSLPSGGTGLFLRCIPRSGRTHQIRVHLTALNLPVVCDKIYLSRRMYALDSAWCPRLFLHAKTLSFKHPVNGEMLQFECGLPKELQRVLVHLDSESK